MQKNNQWKMEKDLQKALAIEYVKNFFKFKKMITRVTVQRKNYLKI